MIDLDITILLNSVIAGATPIVLATLGETITEKAGIINLSLDGSILLCAMAGFVVAYKTQVIVFGFLIAALVGALLACIVAIFSIYFKQSQVAVGFVLTLMARDLAYFIGNPYSRLQGPQVMPQPVYVLHEIPILGEVLFNHNWTVYLSAILILFFWWFIYRTPMGLQLRSVGENPRAAFARGINPHRVQFFYACLGGLIIGLAGATFSLSTKPGWGRPQGAEGTGWIALALVIFGGWHPIKAVLGAYFFSLLQVLGIYFQGVIPSIPGQVIQVAPFPLMIFILVLMSLSQNEFMLELTHKKLWLRRLIEWFQVDAPSSLGKQWHED